MARRSRSRPTRGVRGTGKPGDWFGCTALSIAPSSRSVFHHGLASYATPLPPSAQGGRDAGQQECADPQPRAPSQWLGFRVGEGKLADTSVPPRAQPVEKAGRTVDTRLTPVSEPRFDLDFASKQNATGAALPWRWLTGSFSTGWAVVGTGEMPDRQDCGGPNDAPVSHAPRAQTPQPPRPRPSPRRRPARPAACGPPPRIAVSAARQ